MENDMKTEATNLDNDDTPRSSGTSEDAASPRPPYALHVAAEDKENDRGDATNTRQNKSSKKPQSTESAHSLRAPYAQPVLDASKVDRIKSSVEERLATAKERRLLQRKQLVFGTTDEERSENDMKLRREKEDQAHAKWVQSQEEKRRKMEEGKAKEEAHRREVEQRKKQQIEEEKKKVEARVAKTEQVYEVKMRQKRSASSDRGAKRWSWGGGGGGGGGVSHAETPSPFHYFDATRLTKRTRSGKDKRLSSLHASHFDVSRLGKYYENNEPKYASQVNLSSKSSDRFSHNPYHVNNSHMQFASGLRSYDSRESLPKGPSPESPRQRSSSVGLRSSPPKRSSSMGNIPCKSSTPTQSENTPIKRGRSPTPKGMLVPGSKGRPGSSANLADSIQISPRLLAPTRASLARSRVGEPDNGAAQSSNVTDSKSGPMRSRSKDRRVRGNSSSRPQTASGALDQVSTNKKTRGVSPATKRPMSTSSLQSLTAPTASSQAKSVDHSKVVDEPAKPKRGVSPQAGPGRAPSPKPARPDTAPARPTQKRNPSPAPTKPSAKAPSSEPTKSTPPNIKPSLRPTLTHVRSKSGKSLSVKITEPEKPSRKSMEIKKTATTKPTKITQKKATKQDTVTAASSGTPSLEIVESNERDKNAASSNTNQEATEVPKAQTGASQSQKPVIHDSDVTPSNEPEQKIAEDYANVSAEVKITDQQDAGKEQERSSVQTVSTAENVIQPDQNTTQKTQDDPLLIIEDSDLKTPELAPLEDATPIEATGPQGDATTVQAADSNDEEEQSESTSMSEATVENVSVGSADLENITLQNKELTQNKEGEQSNVKDEPSESNLIIIESTDEPQNLPEPDIKIAAELGFHLNEPTEELPVVTTTVQRALSPADSLEEIEQEGEQMVELEEKPEPKEAWNDDNKENIEPSEDSTSDEKSENAAQDPQESNLEIVEPADAVASQAGASTNSCDPAAVEDVPAAQSEPAVSSEVQTSQVETGASDATPSQPQATQVDVVASVAAPSQQQGATMEVVSTQQEESTESTEAPAIESNAIAPSPGKEEPEKQEESVEINDESGDKQDKIESPPSSEASSTTERKSQPRKNLETDEAKEAYRQAIAEKRRELKEKKEQEERERKERIRLSKIEQAKREEEARKMFEEAAAEAEREKKLEEEKQREREEEEKRREDEAAAKKREAAERLKKEREMQKQKQEDERQARKKRLEMIMRRTRQPDGDGTKSKTEDPTSGSPSPRHTPVSQSPISGRSPTVQSPVGGLSPLTATTPERSVSPSIAAILNRNSIDRNFRTPEIESNSIDDLPNFTNSAVGSERLASTTLEKPVPIDRGMNGVEIRINNTNPLEPATNGRQESSVDELMTNQETLIPGL